MPNIFSLNKKKILLLPARLRASPNSSTTHQKRCRLTDVEILCVCLWLGKTFNSQHNSVFYERHQRRKVSWSVYSIIHQSFSWCQTWATFVVQRKWETWCPVTFGNLFFSKLHGWLCLGDLEVYSWGCSVLVCVCHHHGTSGKSRNRLWWKANGSSSCSLLGAAATSCFLRWYLCLAHQWDLLQWWWDWIGS